MWDRDQPVSHSHPQLASRLGGNDCLKQRRFAWWTKGMIAREPATCFQGHLVLQVRYKREVASSTGLTCPFLVAGEGQEESRSPASTNPVVQHPSNTQIELTVGCCRDSPIVCVASRTGLCFDKDV